VPGAAAIRQASVAVVGIGGVGSWAAEALARSGVGSLVLVDLDHVAESNINRQVHALEGTVGQAKVRPCASASRRSIRAAKCTASRSSPSRATGRRCCRAGSMPSSTPATRSRPRSRWRPGRAPAAPCSSPAGAAGGKRLAHKVDIDDLALTTHDPLLAQLRYRLRKFHGAPREGKRIGVPCVFSREAVAPPDPSCAIDDGDGSLNCHGYGSVVSVTATFGQCAAGWVLDQLVRRNPSAPTL
jgi:tRNA A37 threonylcarbamoyladenosine dehydratase